MLCAISVWNETPLTGFIFPERMQTTRGHTGDSRRGRCQGKKQRRRDRLMDAMGLLQRAAGEMQL